MQKTHGFTILELLVTVALIAILFILAIPSFQTMLERNRVTTTVNDMMASFLLARSAAVTQESNMVIAKLTNWNDGWTVTDTSNVEILRHSTSGAGLSVASFGSNLSNSLTYTPEGRAATALTAGTDYFRITAGDNVRCIYFSATGRPYTGDCP